MENSPEAITAKEGKELKLIDIKEFKLDFNKDLFQVKIAKNESNNKIIIQISKINEIFYF